MPSILGTAYRNEVPVFVPAFTDSELGLDVATHFLAKKYSPDGMQSLEELLRRRAAVQSVLGPL